MIAYARSLLTSRRLIEQLFGMCSILLLSLLILHPVGAQLQDSSNRAAFSVEAIGEGGEPGETNIRAIIEIDKNWHLQANKTQDNLVPTTLEVISPNGAKITKTTFPDAHKISLPGFGELDVYEGTIKVEAVVSVPTAAQSGGKVPLKMELRGQACDDKRCLPPGTWTATVEAPVKEGEPHSKQGDGKTDSNEQVERSDEESTDPDASEKRSEEVEGESDTGKQGIQFLIPEQTPERPPGEVIENLGITVQETQTSSFMNTIQNSLIWALLVAFVWGLFASLSPCVYPMIPLTLSYFGSQGSGEEEEESEPYGRVVGLALVFSIGVSLTFAVLGVIVALIGVELGLALGSPWFVGFLIVLFILLGLSMMELFEIPVPSSLQGMAGGKPGVIGAFTMGAFLGVIAAPCVGPFAAAILAFISASGNVLLGFASMFSFGLGLSMLFLVLAIFGGYSAALSSGTGWLKNVKIFWGFVVLGVTIYFIDLWMALVGLEASTSWVTPLLLGVFGVVFGFWFWSVSVQGEVEGGDRLALRATGKGLALLLLLFGSYYSLAGVIRSDFLVPAPEWLSVSSDGFQGTSNIDSFEEAVQLAQQQGKPIFIDFYADWCIPCKQMDKTVFSDPNVGVFMNEHFVNIKLDTTDGSGWNSKLKQNVFKSASLPMYVFIDAQGNYLPDASLNGKASKKKFLKRAKRVLKTEDNSEEQKKEQKEEQKSSDSESSSEK